jgi:hypothetical protein
MARSTSKARTLLTFNHPTKVTVRESKFELLDSVRHLDLRSLEKAARADVELGEVKTECCHHLVRAVIRKGMVTGLQIEPISKEARTPITPELRKLLGVVKRKLEARRRPGVRFPLAVAKFFGTDIAAISVTTIICVQICMFRWCSSCCFVGDNAFCGRLTIDMTGSPYYPEGQL